MDRTGPFVHLDSQDNIQVWVGNNHHAASCMAVLYPERKASEVDRLHQDSVESGSGSATKHQWLDIHNQYLQVPPAHRDHFQAGHLWFRFLRQEGLAGLHELQSFPSQHWI